MEVSISAKQLKRHGSEYYLQPLKRNWRSLTLLNGWSITILSWLTVFLSAFSHFVNLWPKFYRQKAGGGHMGGVVCSGKAPKGSCSVTLWLILPWREDTYILATMYAFLWRHLIKTFSYSVFTEHYALRYKPVSCKLKRQKHVSS